MASMIIDGQEWIPEFDVWKLVYKYEAKLADAKLSFNDSYVILLEEITKDVQELLA